MGDPYGTFPSSVNVSANPQTVVANNLYADNVGFGIFSAQTGVFSSLVADNITVTGITSSLLNIDEINLNTLDATGACILYLDTQVLTGIAIQAEQAVIQSLVSDQITAQTIISVRLFILTLVLFSMNNLTGEGVEPQIRNSP